MSCWVVPSVAAELWGCSVQSVLDAIAAGHVPHSIENGWTFVDVAPDSPTVRTPKALRDATPPTYNVVTPDELQALTGYPIPGFDSPAPSIAEHDDEAGPLPMEEERSGMHTNWRKARERVARTRKPPAMRAA